MAQVLLTKPKTRYYRKRLWKVVYSLTNLPGFRQTMHKQYFRRPAIGAEWEFVRNSNYKPRHWE